jgi:CHAT domain-containing protein
LGELRRRYDDLTSRFTAFLDRPEVATLLAQIRATTDGQNLDIANQHRALQNNLRALPQETALLYPLILPDRLELVLITADNPPLRYPIAVTGADLNRAIVAMGQALKDPGSDIQPLAQQLYGWLIAPLAPQLEQAGIESIIYAPDGALRYIPLAALHDGSQYLAERFSISHITAVSLTNLNFAPQPDQRRLLAAACAQCSFTITVGDRVFPFGDLPYTATEVNRLAEQVPNTSVLLNRRFSQTELENRLGSFNILHLATHGAVVAEAPRESFLVLGSGETVSLETIRNDWSLSAELVVLSACETAVGSTELGSGVEILGLGYQIQQAGAQAVIASLWQVSDPGTEALMAEFYAALGQGMTKTEALQAAQQALIRNQSAITGGPIRAIALPTAEDGRTLGANAAPGYSHPYYWAPFILIGNGL